MITKESVLSLYASALKALPVLGLAAGLSLAGFLLYQHLTLWYQGSAYSTVYAQSHLPRVQKIPLQKGEVEVKIPCVAVKTIQKVIDSNPKDTNQTSHTYTIQPVPLGVIAGQTPAIESVKLIPNYPLLLSRYIVKAPVVSDLVLESYLDSDGTNRIEPAKIQPNKKFWELGKLREIGLWIGPEWADSHQQNLDQSGNPPNQIGYSFDLSYKQDLLRMGPAWTGLRVEVGHSSANGFGAKAQIGIPIFRF